MSRGGSALGAELYIDATKVVANASLDSLTPRFAVAARAHVGDLFALDAGAAGPPPLGPDAAQDREDEDSPVIVSAPVAEEGDEAALAQANAARHEWIAAAGQRDRTKLAARFHRTADYLVSTTDPDATYLHQREGMRLGYQAHYVVDGGKARIILAALVAPAEVPEDHVALDLLWHARFRWRLHPRLASADKAYASLAIIQALEDQGVRAYVPLPHWNARARYFPKEAFSYDPARDVYTCPGGASLARTRLMKPPRLTLYRAEAATCAACPLRAHCTPGRQGRSIARSYDEGYIARVRAYAGTPAFEKARRKRQVWVEPLFGEAKMWHGLRRFRLRRLWRVNSEAVLTATGQTLKRLLSHRGWGRRPFPSGAPGVLLSGAVRALCPS